MDIWEIALGFMDSKILLTAEEMGIFDSLYAGRNSVTEIAADAKIPESSAERLLGALCAMRLLEKLPGESWFLSGGTSLDRGFTREAFE